MTRNISSLFSEVKIDTDAIRKYLGMPIILQLSEDIEQENDIKSYQESIKKQADALKRIKDKRR